MTTTASTKKNIAVWMDHVQAVIIPDMRQPHVVHHIQSRHESRVRIPGEVNDSAILGVHRSTTTESSKNERKHHELHEFYSAIAQAVLGADELLIFGPTTAPREFSHFVRGRKDFDSTRVSILTSDYMTENQMAHLAQKHFDANAHLPHVRN